MGDEQVINESIKVVREGGGTALVFSPQVHEALRDELIGHIDWVLSQQGDTADKLRLLAEFQRPKVATGQDIITAMHEQADPGAPTAPAPDSEPLFTIRAQDVLAVPALVRYKRLAEASKLFDHAAQVDQAIMEFTRWQDANTERVRNPHHKHGTPVAGRQPYVEAEEG